MMMTIRDPLAEGWDKFFQLHSTTGDTWDLPIRRIVFLGPPIAHSMVKIKLCVGNHLRDIWEKVQPQALAKHEHILNVNLPDLLDYPLVLSSLLNSG